MPLKHTPALVALVMGLATGAAVAVPDAAEPALADKAKAVAGKVEAAVERGAKAAASGIEKGAKAAAHGVRVGAEAAARGVATGARATAKAAEAVADKVSPGNR